MVDPNQIILAATKQALEQNYPHVDILTAVDAQSARSLVEQYRPMLVLLDLILPETPYSPASPKVGIQLVQTLMQADSAPHIAVSSTKVMSLVRIKRLIKNYTSGFAAGEKFTLIEEMLRLVDFAFRGSIYLPQLLINCPEFKPKLIEVLRLKFEEGYTDCAIAKEMGISDRTVRNCWLKIVKKLSICVESRKDTKIQIEIAARRIGLID